MPSLTKDQLRKGSPADTLPYRVVRKYGEPKLYGKVADVKSALLKDISEIRQLLEGSKPGQPPVRTAAPADTQALAWLESEITANLGPTPNLPLSIDVVVDSYTGTRYQVTVTDRRML